MDTQYSHTRRKGEVELQLIHVVSAVVCSWHRWCSLADALVSKHPATSLVHHPDANFLNSSSIFATFVMSWIGYDKLVNQTCHNDEVFDFRIHTSSFFNNFHFISPLFVSCHHCSTDHQGPLTTNLSPPPTFHLSIHTPSEEILQCSFFWHWTGIKSFASTATCLALLDPHPVVQSIS